MIKTPNSIPLGRAHNSYKTSLFDVVITDIGPASHIAL